MKVVILILAVFISVGSMGCATSKIATDIGVSIGNSYQESAAKGTVSAEQSIKVWPYVSGQIKGLMAAQYDLLMSKMSTDIIDKLDVLAAKESLTTEEKGLVIGYFVRLEIIALKDNWDNYGVSIFNMLVNAIGG